MNTVLFYFNFGHPKFSSPIPIAQSLTDNAFEKRFSNCESCTLIEAGKYSQDSTPYRRKLDKWQREPQKQKQNKALIQFWFYQCLHCWPFVGWQMTIINPQSTLKISQSILFVPFYIYIYIYLPNLRFNKQVQNRYISNEDDYLDFSLWLGLFGGIRVLFLYVNLQSNYCHSEETQNSYSPTSSLSSKSTCVICFSFL